MCIASFIGAVILIFLAEQLYVRIARIDFKDLPSWEKDIFGGAFVVLASIVICSLVDWNKAAFTLTGCTLELAGITQAIITLLQVRQHFDLPRLRDLFKAWLESFQKEPPTTITASCTVSCGVSASVSAIVFPGGEIDQTQPLDQQVDLLIQHMKLCSQRLIENHTEIIQLKSELNKISTDTLRDIEAKTAELNKGLEQLHVGDFTPTLIGLVWIAAGTIMGAIGSLL